MSETSQRYLYLYLHDGPLPPGDIPAHLATQALAYSESLAGPWQQAPLQQLAGQYPPEQCAWVVLLPGHLILSTTLEVPPKQLKHLSKILPFLCEEDLACDPAAVHIGTGRPRNSTVPVRIIERQWLTALVAAFREQGVVLAGLYSECEALSAALPPEHALLWLEGDTCHWVHGGHGITTSAHNAGLLLQKLVETAGVDATAAQPQLHLCCATGNRKPLSAPLNLLQASGWQVQLSEVSPAETPVPPCYPLTDALPAKTLPEKTLSDHSTGLYGINLLSGAFAPPRRQSRHPLPLRAATIAASALILLTLTYQLASGWYLQHRAAQLARQNEALYRHYFPDDRRVIDIRRQTEAHLSQAGNASSAGFFHLLDSVHNQWRSHDDTLQLQAIIYQRPRKEMLLDVEAGSIAQLDGLQRRLGQQAELLSASEVAQRGVRGRLRINGE